MAAGDISAPVDTLIWNALAVLQPRAVHVAGDVYAFVFEEATDQGKVATVEIDSAGEIGAAIIDSLSFEGTAMGWPDIIHVSGNVFAIVHSGVDDDGFLHTVTINNDGSIDGAVIDSFEFATADCGLPRLFHIAGTTFGISFESGGVGVIVTVTIDNDGEITDPRLDVKIFDATSCYFSVPIKIADNIFAIFYNRSNGPAWVTTLTIADNGTITDVPLDTLQIDAGVCLISDACLVGAGIYAYTYQKSDYFYYLATVDIAATGAIGSVLDTLKFEPAASMGSRLSPLRISETILCVAYSGPDSDGFMKTIEIDAAGAITDPVLDTLEFDTSVCKDVMIISIAEDIYAVFYQGSSDFGTIITPGIAAPVVAAATQHLMIMGVG